MHCKGYSSSLSPNLLKIYSKKLNDFHISDPYELSFSELMENFDDWPMIERSDIMDYLVHGTHTYTREQMKAFRSLEAHNYYTSGWVNNRVFHKLLPEDRLIMLGEVSEIDFGYLCILC